MGFNGNTGGFSVFFVVLLRCVSGVRPVFL